MAANRPGFSPPHLYEYLTVARERLLDWVRPLTLEQYTRQFPFGLKTLRDTFVEITNAEWLYVQRLMGEHVPPYDTWPFVRFYKTEFAPLETAWRAQVPETRRVLQSIPDWFRPVEYVVRDDEGTVRIRTTTGGIAAQLLFHEVHHRAQAMAMLRQLGISAQDLDYNALMYQREPLAT